MNHTTKARYDFAKRMIAGHLDVSEVVEMTERPLAEVQKLKDEFDKVTMSELDGMNIDMGPVLYDNYVTEEEQEDYDIIKAQVDKATMPEEESINSTGETK